MHVPGEPDLSRRSWPRRALNRLELDRATFYSVAIRAWQLIAGPVTILLIAAFFSLEVQDHYYAFASLVGLQTLFEMSLSVVIVSVTSYEWSRLSIGSDGRLTGDPAAVSRVISLGRWAFGWYAAMGVLFALAMGVAGALLFQQKASTVEWAAPWACVVVLTSLSMCALPLLSILEGTSELVTINRYRALQAVLGNLAVWSLILLGAGLWTTVAAAAVKLACDWYPVLVRYRRLFAPFLSRISGPAIDWRTEVWPLQWRMAVQAAALAAATASFTLVMFHYQGEGEAGRMGMTFTGLTALHWGTLAWLLNRRPMFGGYVAEGRFDQFDRVFKRLTAISFALRVAGGLTFWGIVFALNHYDVWIADRLLPPLETGLLIAAVVLDHIPCSLTIYARAHKREPYLRLSVLSNVAIIVCVWWLGSGTWGARGAACAYLAIMALMMVPAWTWLWAKQRREWRPAAAVSAHGVENVAR